jgi:hypothetical protein
VPDNAEYRQERSYLFIVGQLINCHVYHSTACYEFISGCMLTVANAHGEVNDVVIKKNGWMIHAGPDSSIPGFDFSPSVSYVHGPVLISWSDT